MKSLSLIAASLLCTTVFASQPESNPGSINNPNQSRGTADAGAGTNTAWASSDKKADAYRAEDATGTSDIGQGSYTSFYIGNFVKPNLFPLSTP